MTRRTRTHRPNSTAWSLRVLLTKTEISHVTCYKIVTGIVKTQKPRKRSIFVFSKLHCRSIRNVCEKSRLVPLSTNVGPQILIENETPDATRYLELLKTLIDRYNGN